MISSAKNRLVPSTLCTETITTKLYNVLVYRAQAHVLLYITPINGLSM